MVESEESKSFQRRGRERRLEGWKEGITCPVYWLINSCSSTSVVYERKEKRSSYTHLHLHFHAHASSPSVLSHARPLPILLSSPQQKSHYWLYFLQQGARSSRAASRLIRQQLSRRLSLRRHFPTPSSDSFLGPSFHYLHHHSSSPVFPESLLSYPSICHFH